MKKCLLFLISAALLTAAKPDSKTEKEVLAAMDAYKQAMLKKDVKALSAILSDDLTYTHSSNQHQDKAALLAAQEKSALESLEIKDPKVRVYGNTALVTGDVDVRNKEAGAVTVIHLHVLHVLVKGPSGWQLTARQATRYPEPAGAKK